MGSVESVCLEQGETLGDVVAQSCLFQSKKTFNGINGQELIWHVFSEVANELGVRKHSASSYLRSSVEPACTNDVCARHWMLLLCKLESIISNDSWQMILNRTRLGKSGLSQPPTIFCVVVVAVVFFKLTRTIK